MRLLIALLLTVCCLRAADRYDELDVLKKAFPAHVVGEVTDKSDPLIQETYFKYRKAVNALGIERLAEELLRLRKELDRDIAALERSQSDAGSSKKSTRVSDVMTPSMRHATEKNLSWLKIKLRPYVARLESFQRGRKS